MILKNKKLTFFCPIILLIFLHFNSFGQFVIYIPDSGNTLKLQEQKELNLSISGFRERQGELNSNFGSTIKKNYNLQLAYSPFKHLGISVHHSGLSQPWSSYFNTVNLKGNQTGLGIGGYYVLPCQGRKKSNKLPCKNFLFDIYSGFTLGDFRTTERIQNPFTSKITNRNSSLVFQKIYLQGGFHLIGQYVHISGIIKAGNINFTKGTLNGDWNRIYVDEVREILNREKSIFIEWTLKAEFNYKGVGTYFEFSEMISGFDKNIDAISPLINVGLVFNLHAIKENYFKKK